MFRFEHPYYLYFLLLIPVIVMLSEINQFYGKSAKKSVAEETLLRRLMPGWQKSRKRIRFFLFLLAVAFMILALANPQWSGKREKITVTSSDIFIALDISRSMMVEDLPPNRLERAKKVVESLVEALKGNRIGLILFAGDAFIQVPLTTDYAAVLLTLKSAHPDQIIHQGTAISESLEIAQKSFSEGEKHQRAIILVTDGEDHDGDAISKARDVYEDGMLIFTIGVGSGEGGFVPETSYSGSVVYKKDEEGKFVKSRVNEELLRDLATAGKGDYFNVLEGDSLVEKLTMQLERLEKREMEQRSFTAYESYFGFLLILALVMLIAEFFWPEKKK
jgi:Ca-activated chloride channel homolog